MDPALRLRVGGSSQQTEAPVPQARPPLTAQGGAAGEGPPPFSMGSMGVGFFGQPTSTRTSALSIAAPRIPFPWGEYVGGTPDPSSSYLRGGVWGGMCVSNQLLPFSSPPVPGRLFSEKAAEGGRSPPPPPLTPPSGSKGDPTTPPPYLHSPQHPLGGGGSAAQGPEREGEEEEDDDKEGSILRGIDPLKLEAQKRQLPGPPPSLPSPLSATSKGSRIGTRGYQTIDNVIF